MKAFSEGASSLRVQKSPVGTPGCDSSRQEKKRKNEVVTTMTRFELARPKPSDD